MILNYRRIDFNILEALIWEKDKLNPSFLKVVFKFKIEYLYNMHYLALVLKKIKIEISVDIVWL